ncbi:MAG TPA: glucuronyl hydrolase [Polyangia bacterium]|nr:glucuronyl hydrolase [Polyangia bacterium]
MQRCNRLLCAFLTLSACSANNASPGSSGTGGSGSGGASAGGSGGTSTTTGSGGAGLLDGSTTGGGGSASDAAGQGAAGGGGDSAGGGTDGSADASADAPGQPSLDVAFCSTALDAAVVQYTRFRTAYTSAANLPRTAKNGVVTTVPITDWTSGFVGGSYWYLYEYSKDAAFRTAAESAGAALEPQKTTTIDHDLGFRFMSTFGNNYRLTSNANALAVLKTAAASLSTRFHAVVGVIKSWDNPQWDYPVIIDNMMNLRLLYFVSANGGDPTYADQATQHALTTLKNHFRPDNSSFHLVNYNSTTGAVISKVTVQGLANSSAWARGQAWGLYGYTESFVASKRPEFLAQAQKIAAFLMTHKNMPADRVPYWDFDAPAGASTPRDASAAAIMASGLLQLSGLVQEPDASKYRDYALAILKSLTSPAYAAAAGQNSFFLLMHSTGNLPGNSEIDVPINYADYYYLESLMRCRALAH